MKNTILAIIIFSLSPILSYSQENSLSNSEISLIFIGDFMGHQDQIDAAYDSINNSYNYASCFKYISASLSDADFTIANLEVTLGSKPYSGYPQFSSPPEFAKAIKDAGIDILSTANNHSVDKSKAGIEKTISILDSLNIQHIGTYISPKEKNILSPLIIKKNDIRIALLSYTYGTNSLVAPKPCIVNYLDSTTILNDIKSVKKDSIDAIIAFVHWGTQYKNFPNNTQKNWFNYFKSLGVKIVIGSHPHVVQPMIWNKKDSSLVVYSLGNFISHQRTFPRDGGAYVKIILRKHNNIISIEDVKYSLSWVYEPLENGKKNYYVLPASEFEKKPSFFNRQKDYTKMMRYIKHARGHLDSNNINIMEY